MPNLRSIDMLLVDDLFETHGGYVLNFSDRTFAIFFAEELNIDIDDPIYSRNGGSKAKRLRCFLQTVDKGIAVRALKALWEYREAARMRSKQEEALLNAQGRFLQLIQKLEGTEAKGSEPAGVKPAIERAKYAGLQSTLMSLAGHAGLHPVPKTPS